MKKVFLSELKIDDDSGAVVDEQIHSSVRGIVFVRLTALFARMCKYWARHVHLKLDLLSDSLDRFMRLFQYWPDSIASVPLTLMKIPWLENENSHSEVFWSMTNR
jgi:hypothetical protein